MGATNTGTITLGATTIAANDRLTLGGATVSLSTLSGSAIDMGQVIFNTTGSVAVSGVIGGASGTTALQSLTFAANSAAVTFSNGASVQNAVTFSNSGGVSLTGTFNFNGGVISTASNTVLNGNLYSNGGAIALAVATLSGGTSTIDTTRNSTTAGANITLGVIAGTTTGTQSLAINSGTAGTINLNGTVGTSSIALNTFNTTGFDTIINNTAINTTGAQQYNGAVNVSATKSTLTSSGAAIAFVSTVDGSISGGNELDTASNMGTTFTQNVGSSKALSALAVSGASTVKAASVKTTGAQTFDGALALTSSNTNLTSSAGSLTFSSTINSTVDGNTNLVLNGSTGVSLNNSIGNLASERLGSLDVTGLTTINAAGITTTGKQEFHSGVTLNSSDTMTSGNVVTFDSSLNSAAAVGSSLTVTGTSGVNFDGAIGGAMNGALTNLNVTGSSSLASIDLNTPSINTSGSQIYNTAVTLLADSSLTSSASTIEFKNTIDGADNLILNGNTGVSLDNSLGATTNLTSLTVKGPATINSAVITTTAAQQYQGTVLFSSTASHLTASSVEFDNTVNGATQLTASGTSGVTFKNSIGNTSSLTSLNVTGATSLNSAVINTIGAQTYNSAITLVSSSQMTSSSNGNLTFDAAINGGANNLTTVTGNGITTFYGAITNTANLAVTANSIDLQNGNITTTGNQTYGTNMVSPLLLSAVTLDNDAVLTSSAGGNIQVNGNITNQGHLLTISTSTAGSNATLVGKLSGTGGLTLNGSGTLDLDSSNNNYSGNTAVNSGILQLMNNTAVSAASNMNLASGAQFDLNGYAGTLPLLTGSGLVTLSRTGNAGTLTVNNASSDSFSGTIRDLTSGSSANGGNVTKTGAGVLTLTGASSYSGNTAISNGTVNLQSNLGLGASTVSVASGAELDVNTNITVANNIALHGNGTTTNGALVATSNDILTGNIMLNSNTSIGVTGSADVLTLQGVVSGTAAGANLTKVGLGTLILSNANNSYAGDTNVLAGTLSLTQVTAIPSTSALNLAAGANVTLTNVSQISFASLSGGGALNISGTNITVGSDNSNSEYTGTITGTGSLNKVGTGTLTLDGNNSITGLTTVTDGTLVFGSVNYTTVSNVTLVNVAAGASLELNDSTFTANSISINGSGVNNLGALIGVGRSSFTGTLNLSSNATIATKDTADKFRVNGDVKGSYDLSTLGAGNITVNGNIGSKAHPLTSVTTSTSGTTTIEEAVVTSGNQNFNDQVILSNDTSLTSTNGAVNVSANIDGASSLTISSALGVDLAGSVGGNVALTNLKVNGSAGSSVTLGGGGVTTSAFQTYNVPVILGSANTTLTSGSDILLAQGVSGAGNNLNLVGSANDNTFTLDGNVAINALTVSGSSSGNNTLTLKTNNAAQNFAISSANGGSVTGITEETGAFTYGNIENLVGGNYANTFSLINGGTLAGSITGGTGINTLVADNVVNTFTISGTNSGLLTGINGFSNIQNLTGGDLNNSFIFTGGGNLSGGMINGGLISNTNTLDFSNYSAGVNILLTDKSGSVTAANASAINNFINIDNLMSNGKGALTVDGTNNVITLTAPLSGYVNDPTYFTGFNTLGATSTASDTRVIFGVSANFNSSTDQAFINGIAHNFVNINVIDSLRSEFNSEFNNVIDSATTGISNGFDYNPFVSVDGNGSNDILFSGSPANSDTNNAITVNNNVGTCASWFGKQDSNGGVTINNNGSTVDSNCGN